MHILAFINNMDLKDRIKAVKEYSGKKNLSEFSRSVGFKTPQAVRELISGNTKTLSDSAATLLLRAFPELNEKWLKDGIGDMFNPNQSRVIGDVKDGGMAQQGDNTMMLKDVKIQIEDELAAGYIPANEESCRKEIKKLRQLLSKAEKEIARLNGKVEEQDKFIKLLLDRK